MSGSGHAKAPATMWVTGASYHLKDISPCGS